MSHTHLKKNFFTVGHVVCYIYQSLKSYESRDNKNSVYICIDIFNSRHNQVPFYDYHYLRNQLTAQHQNFTSKHSLV